jgi:hypothetical protein
MSEGLHSGVHPGSDALNAFVERALPEHDRLECLAHLAECAQCREVVFLAQKAAELAEPVGIAKPVAAPQAPVSFWQRLLRPTAVVSVVAAAIVAVFSLGLYRMVRPAEPQPQVTASTEAPAAPESAATAPAAPARAVTRPEEQPPGLQPTTLQPTPRNVSPPPVPREQEQPPASPAPPPAAAAAAVAAPAVAPPEVALSPPPPPPPPAAVLAADTALVANLAQEAGVVGTISDPAGAVISSARVELKSEDTGVTYTSSSDARGQYSIAGLAPGRYDFSVTVPGFKKLVKPGINVQPQEMARLDSALQIGAASESVTVTAEAPLLKTESGELSHNVDVTSLNQLPLLTGAPGNARAITGASPVYTLPDKSTPVSVAAKEKLVLAVDSAGALFVSENAGKIWTRVKAAWKGKVVRVAVSANTMFQLTTNPASTWVSTDGRHWSESHAPR